MPKRYRVGFASLVHDHVWGELKHWKQLPNVEIVACGDINAELREKFTAESGCGKTYNSWQEMIAGEDLDIVQAASGAAQTNVNCASSITSAPAANDRPRHHIEIIVSVIYDARKPLRRA